MKTLNSLNVIVNSTINGSLKCQSSIQLTRKRNLNIVVNGVTCEKNHDNVNNYVIKILFLFIYMMGIKVVLIIDRRIVLFCRDKAKKWFYCLRNYNKFVVAIYIYLIMNH